MIKSILKPWNATRKHDTQGHAYWYFIPPVDARRKGFIKAQNLGGNTKKAIETANELKAVYERWKRGEAVSPVVIPRGSWQDAADLYQQSPAFLVDLGERTRASYTSGLKAFLGEPCPWKPDTAMAFVPVSALTEDRAQLLYSQLQRFQAVDGRMRPTRAAMANLVMAVASKVWQAARSKGFVSGDNPLLLVTKHRPVNTRTLWTFDYLRRYVEAGWDRQTHWRGRHYPVRSVCMAAALQFDLWQRQGDILALKWQDWDGEFFTVTPSKTERKVGHPIYPVPSAWTVNLLNELYRINNPRPEDYIITNERTGTRYKGPGALRKIHINILKEAGLPAGLTLLDLRRSGINEGTDAGISAAHGMAQSGHATQSTFLQVYNQPSKAKTKLVREKLDAHRGQK